MLAPVRTVAPLDAVTLVEAKEHLRVDGAEEDSIIGLFVDAATERLDGFDGILGRCLATQTWQQGYEDFSGRIVLPLGPVKSVSSVSYKDESGGTETFTDFELKTINGISELFPTEGNSWPTGSSVEVTFVCGDASIPSPIKAAILIHVGTMFEFRESLGTKVSPTGCYEALIQPYRRKMV